MRARTFKRASKASSFKANVEAYQAAFYEVPEHKTVEIG